MNESIDRDEIQNTIDGAAVRESVIRAVQFKVDVIVGDATLSLSEIERLESGSVIPLSRGLNESISLQLNDVEIARGELVSVGDKFAVKITHVSE